MPDLTPHVPQYRPLLWDDFVLNLQDELLTLHPHEAYIVGGAVRDASLHRAIKDIDIVTPYGDAIPLARRITNHFNGDIYIMDKERDVARVFIHTADGRKIVDVAGFRGEDFAHDLMERDFTINAIACDLRGDLALIIDPLNGEQDAFDKIIRRCYSQSLFDDPLRTLRAIRQSVQLNMRIEPATLADVRQAVAQLPTVSAERIRDEFFNMLALSRPVAALRVVQALGIFEHITPDFAVRFTPETWRSAFITVEKLHAILTAISPYRTDNTVAVFDLGMLTMQFDRYRTQLRQHTMQTVANERPHWAVLLLGALVHHAPDALPHIVHDLRLSTSEAHTLNGMQRPQLELRELLASDSITDLQKHRFWYPLGISGIDAIFLALAVHLAEAGTNLHQQTWLRYVDNAQILMDAYFNHHERLVQPPTIVDGHALMTELSLQGGRIIGELLTTIREAQVIGQVTNTEQAMTLARDYLKSSL